MFCDIMINLRHVGIVVEDLQRSLVFYRDLLGLVVQQSADEKGAFIDALLAMENVRVTTVKLSAPEGPTLLELLKFDDPVAKAGPIRPVFGMGLTHVAFTVRDLDKTWRSLCVAGIRFNAPPQISLDGNAKVAYCQDFEGNFVELVEQMPPQDRISKGSSSS